MKSFIYGRIGSTDSVTGLFVLAANATPEVADTIKAVSLTRTGYEFNSSHTYRQPGDDPQHTFAFLNQTSRHSKYLEDFYLHVEGHQKNSKLAEAIYWEPEKKKLGNKVYCSKIMGIAPRKKVLKVILRESGVGTKRVLLFGLGYLPSEGGKTWIVSPHGFPWYTTTRNVVDEFDGNITPCLKDDYLFLAVTGAVPLISGPIQRQRDEDHPRILWGHEEPYPNIMFPMSPLFEQIRRTMEDDKYNQQYHRDKQGVGNSLWRAAADPLEHLGILPNSSGVVEETPVLTTEVIDLSDMDIMF